MTVKEELEGIIQSHARKAESALGQIDNHVQEEERLLQMAHKCTERIQEIESEILVNSEQIKKLKEIVEQL